MITCTFFGHRDATSEIKQMVRETVTELITVYGVELFLVGDSGSFDRIVKGVLTELSRLYDFEFQVVLSQIPTKSGSFEDASICVVPEGIESALPRFRIDFRNRYMLNSSDYVIAYVNRCYGGAFKYYEMAKRRNKKVINLAEE